MTTTTTAPTFVYWRLNEPIEERYRPTKTHAAAPGASYGDRTLCGLTIPHQPYDIDWQAHPIDDGTGSCARCRRKLAELVPAGGAQ